MLLAEFDPKRTFGTSASGSTGSGLISTSGVAETKFQVFVYDKIRPQSETVIKIATIIGKSTSNT